MGDILREKIYHIISSKPVVCPECHKEFFDSRHKDQCDFIQNLGKCEECCIKEKGLIKIGNHYVSYGYRNYINSDGSEEPAEEEHYEDVNAFLPKISWNGFYRKWQVKFSGADSGGYDVQNFIWYFSTLEGIINEMKGNGRE